MPDLQGGRRRAAWTRLFTRALRLEFAAAPLEPLFVHRSWWFDDFKVEPEHDRFRVHGCDGWVAPATLRLEEVTRIEASLQTGFDLLAEYLADTEARRGPAAPVR